MVAKGAQSVWTKWDKREFSCWLVIGLVVLVVVKERVEVRLFWRIARVRLAYVDLIGETRARESIKTTAGEPKSTGVYRELAASRLQCHGL